MTTPTDTLIDWLTGRDADEGEVIAALGTAWAGPPLGQVRERAPRLAEELDELDDPRDAEGRQFVAATEAQRASGSVTS